MTNSKNNPTPTLGDQISQLLQDPARTADAVQQLLDRAEPEVERLRKQAGRARADALDPVRMWSEINMLREAAEQAEFEAERIERAVEVLEAEHARLEHQEEVVKYDQLRKEARAASEATALRIREEYPQIAAAFLNLVEDIERTNRMIAAARGGPDPEAELVTAPLEGPEGLARGFNQFWGTMPNRPPMLIVDAVLPRFDPSSLPLWSKDDQDVHAARAALKAGVAFVDDGGRAQTVA